MRRSAALGIGLILLGGGGLIAGVAAATPATPQTRTIEVSIRYSHFDPDVFDVNRGETVRFVVHNLDPIDHEFIIGDQVVQQAHEDGTESYHPPRPGEMTVPAGATLETTYTFPASPGELILGCHLPGHYAYGMHAPIRIR